MCDDEQEKSQIEILREKNLAERNAFLASVMKDPLFSETIEGIKELQEEFKPKVSRKTIKRKKGDEVFKFTGAIPKERRISARLQHKKPDFSHHDLPDERGISHDPDYVDDLEEVVYEVKRVRKPTARSGPPAKIIPVEEVTENMIKKVQTSGNKVYGQDGTSCHQCRQKTVDTKTICRSGFCIGVRGQFCGICVINRYGEDPIKALKDPNWKCYVCRGCCNCSFCRAKEGKRPTGILAPLAKMNGFKSVMEFLQNLKGFGDYEDPQKNPENLLGFDGDVAVLGGYKKEEMKCKFGCKTTANRIKPDPDNLLGFDGNFATFVDNKRTEIKCYYGCD